MFHATLIPLVQKALSQSRQEVQSPVRLAQQKRPAIAADAAPVEPGHDLSVAAPVKEETRLDTLCHSEGRLFVDVTACVETQLSHEQRPFAYCW
jgi:hypothetical protein